VNRKNKRLTHLQSNADSGPRKSGLRNVLNGNIDHSLGGEDKLCNITHAPSYLRRCSYAFQTSLYQVSHEDLPPARIIAFGRSGRVASEGLGQSLGIGVN